MLVHIGKLHFHLGNRLTRVLDRVAGRHNTPRPMAPSPNGDPNARNLKAASVAAAQAPNAAKVSAVAFFVGCVAAYICITSIEHKGDFGWAGVARVCLVFAWLFDGVGLLYVDHLYIARHKLEVFVVILIVCVVLAFLVASLMDEIGIFMASVTTGVIFPELRKDLVRRLVPAPEPGLPF
ncbi:hypothetical protein B0T24DRAFT_676244 [Lasiosphaeria ovina]|uniref:Uncharacterized protein n=1 Tax=Lasiosphaeria ovina TaxID=92902 RepID=A0AAE0NFL0_9PEZI|nr:hypothetical protein B0T24DRAFT_676244 [Lasiosphaeria ovina]